MTYRRAFTFLLSALLAGSAFADGVLPARDRATLFVATHLDVLSIPSSIYPRRRPGAHTLADYGFAHFDAVDGGMQSIDRDTAWVFGIRIVEDDGGRKILCVQDHALADATAASQTAIEVKIGPTGLFHGTGRTPLNAQCPLYQR